MWQPPQRPKAPPRFSPETFTSTSSPAAKHHPASANTVRFSPCARTAWHSHSLGQTLHVTDGIGVVATRDSVIIMRAGDTVHTPPGEEHWHGALTDHFMSHLAMWEDDDATWGAHVTDDEYAAATSADPRKEK